MFLNMLIAIMGSTFMRVTNNREKASLIERVTLYTDWFWLITFEEKLQNAPYLYVMIPKADDSQQKEAAAAEARRENLLKKLNSKQNKMQQQIDKIYEMIEEMSTR